jgi:alpha-1,2-rhamnosyltransferase
MRIFLDCTASYWRPHNSSGVQRVAREIARRHALAPAGCECTPVHWSLGAWRRVSRTWRPYVTLRHLARQVQTLAAALRVRLRSGNVAVLPFLALVLLSYLALRLAVQLTGWVAALRDPAVALAPGDTLFMPEYPYRNQFAIRRAHARGVRLVAVIHDLIPFTHPQLVRWPSSLPDWFDWLGRNAHRILGVSAFVEGELRRRYGREGLGLGHFHNGADFAVPAGEDLPRSVPAGAPYFLMVGTLAPHKGHAFALDAFEAAWARGCPARLVILGRRGWMTDDLVARLNAHPERRNRLLWLDDASDAQLAAAYRDAHALIAASIVEGFGLPLVEALMRGAPVLASDIPVFREVAGDAAEYFPLGDPSDLAAIVERRAAEPRRSVPPFRWLTWDESARRALELAAAP